jgi:hypothetical protein
VIRFLSPRRSVIFPSVLTSAKCFLCRGFRNRLHSSTAISLVLHVIGLVGMALAFSSSKPSIDPVSITMSTAPLDDGIDLESRTLQVEIPFPDQVTVEHTALEIPSSSGPHEPLHQSFEVGSFDLENVAVRDAMNGTAASVASMVILTSSSYSRATGGEVRAGARRGQGLGMGLTTGGGDPIGRRLARAGAGTGDIQVSLAWNNWNDLDLHVMTPFGQQIFFGNRVSSCMGMLDIDMNAGGFRSLEPVENIFWPHGRAPSGKFVIAVHHYANHGGQDPSEFEVRLLIDGETRSFKGSVASGQWATVHEFVRNRTVAAVQTPPNRTHQLPESTNRADEEFPE